MVKRFLRAIDSLVRPRPRPRTDTARTPAPPAAGYPGDFRGRPPIEYAPVEGKLPDPGEIVWAWVPYEEDHTRGKERPVLLIGRDDPWLLAVPLTSKDHDRDRDQEASQGRFWIDVGTGAWDRSGRPSEARTNRVIRVEPGAVRRAGVRLDRRRFDAVAGEIRQHLT